MVSQDRPLRDYLADVREIGAATRDQGRPPGPAAADTAAPEALYAVIAGASVASPCARWCRGFATVRSPLRGRVGSHSAAALRETMAVLRAQGPGTALANAPGIMLRRSLLATSAVCL